MPPKKKTEPPQAPAGPRTRNAPIDITNWRQQSQNRARERNRITFMAPALGDRMRELRVSKGMSQPEVAYGLELPDGTPHPIMWRVLERAEDPAANQRATRDAAAKVVNRLESYTQEPTLSLAWAWCHALGFDIATVLQGLGWSHRSASTEASILADERLSAEGRQAMLMVLQQLLAGGD